MKYEIRNTSESHEPNIWLESGPKESAIDDQVNRLKAWALIRGARIMGQPFIVQTESGEITAHLPVDGVIRPHPETGLHFQEPVAGSPERAAAEVGELTASAPAH